MFSKIARDFVRDFNLRKNVPVAETAASDDEYVWFFGWFHFMESFSVDAQSGSEVGSAYWVDLDGKCLLFFVFFFVGAVLSDECHEPHGEVCAAVWGHVADENAELGAFESVVSAGVFDFCAEFVAADVEYDEGLHGMNLLVRVWFGLYQGQTYGLWVSSPRRNRTIS